MDNKYVQEFILMNIKLTLNKILNQNGKAVTFLFLRIKCRDYFLQTPVGIKRLLNFKGSYISVTSWCICTNPANFYTYLIE